MHFNPTFIEIHTVYLILETERNFSMKKNFKKKITESFNLINKFDLLSPQKYLMNATGMLVISDLNTLNENDKDFVRDELFPIVITFITMAPNDLVYALYACPFIANIVPGLSFATVRALFEPEKDEIVKIHLSCLINTAILIHDCFLKDYEIHHEEVLEILEQIDFELPDDSKIENYLDVYKKAINNPIGLKEKIHDDTPEAALMALSYLRPMINRFKEMYNKLENEHKALIDGVILRNKSILPDNNDDFKSLTDQFKFTLKHFQKINRKIRKSIFSIDRITYNPFLYETVTLTPALDVFLVPLKQEKYIERITAGCYTSFTYGASPRTDGYDALDDLTYTDDLGTIKHYFYDLADKDIYDVLDTTKSYYKTANSNLRQPFKCCQAAKQYIDDFILKNSINLYLILAKSEQQSVMYYEQLDIDRIITKQPFISDTALITNASLPNGFLALPNADRLTHLLCEPCFINPLVLSFFCSLCCVLPIFDSETDKYHEEENNYLKVADIINTMFANHKLSGNNKSIAYVSKDSYTDADVTDIEKNITARIGLYIINNIGSDMYLNTTNMYNYCFFFDEEDFYYDYTFYIGAALLNVAFNDDYPDMFIGYRGAPIEKDICKRIRESIRMLTQRLIETGDAPTLLETHKRLGQLYVDLKGLAVR